MDPTHRIVTRIPVEELWDADGPVSAQRGEPVDAMAVKEKLRGRSLRFVVADVGRPLLWVEPDAAALFWKSEVQPRLATSDSFFLRDFPGDYAYVATDWSGPAIGDLIVLERHH